MINDTMPTPAAGRADQSVGHRADHWVADGSGFEVRDARLHALAGGVLYLVTIVSSIPAALLLESALTNGSPALAGGSDTRVLVAGLLDLVNALACAGTAVALYPIARRVRESMAIGYAASRVLEAAVIAIGVISLLAAVTLRRSLDGGVDGEVLDTVQRGLVEVRNWTFLLGPSLCAAFNAIFLGTVMRGARLVPRWIPTLGLIGAPLLLTSALVALLRGNEVVVPLHAVAVAPIFIWEFSLGLWLTFRGVRRPSV